MIKMISILTKYLEKNQIFKTMKINYNFFKKKKIKNIKE